MEYRRIFALEVWWGEVLKWREDCNKLPPFARKPMPSLDYYLEYYGYKREPAVVSGDEKERQGCTDDAPSSPSV